MVDYFKSRYNTSANFAINVGCLPYQSKQFIKPACVVHQHSVTNEIVSETTINGDTEAKAQQEFWMIFKRTSHKIPNTILIEGTSGMGKTILAKEIASQWAQGLLLTNIQLLLLVYLRNVAIHKMTNFEELLQCCYTDKDVASNCAMHFTKFRGKNLMIIFDGYDEMAAENQQYDETFFMNLLKRRILPECNLVVTSVPYITAHLHHYCDCRVEIMGFTKAGRHNYCKENLSSKKYQIAIEFFQKYPMIDNLGYIPLHLINFLSLVEHDIQLPRTQTELIGNAVCLTIACNTRKSVNINVSILQDEKIDKIITSIAPFAYKMLKKEQFVFSETDIKSTGIQIGDNSDKYGLLKAVNYVQNTQHEKLYSFIHLSVQKYLAAYYLSRMFSTAQTFTQMHQIWDEKYLSFWKIYADLMKGNNFPFKEFSERFGTGMMLQYKFPGMTKELKISKFSCLKLYQIFLDVPDGKVKESVSSVVTNDVINLSSENLSITDMNIISHYIVRSHVTVDWQMIDLSHCNIDDTGLDFLCHLSNIEDGREKPSIKCLNISCNNIQKLSTLLNLVSACKIRELFANNNMCRDDHYTCKGSHFCTLEVLDLSSNQLQNKDIIALCDALCKHQNMRELIINKSFLNEDIRRVLVTSILQWNNFERLECKENCFQDDNFTAELIQFTMAQMKLYGTIISFDNSLDHISYFLVLLECITDLTVEQSNFIMQLSKVTDLSLDCRDKLKQSIPPTLNVQASRSFKFFKNLVTLNLSGVSISDDAADGLALAFSGNLLSLRNLLMNNCNLNSNIFIKFMGSLKYAKHISTIDMGNNCINDEAMEALVVAILHWNLQNTKIINLENNSINLGILEFLNTLLIESFEDLSIHFNNLKHVIIFIKLIEYMSSVPSEVSNFVSNLTSICTLTLECLQENVTNHKAVLTIKMSQYLKRFVNLTTLNISGIVIDEQSVDALSDTFATHLKMLQQLVMNGCELDSKSTIKLVRRLRHKNIKEIQLCDNFIDDEATEEIIIAILHWNSLEVIKLENNHFNEESSFAIQFLLSFFNHNDNFDQGILELECKLENIKSFITLLHCMNGIETKNSNFICLIVKLNELHSYIFDLGCLNEETRDLINLEFTFDGLVFFQRFVNLQYLDISGITLNERSVDTLAIAFGSNLLSLEYLFMTDCRITSKAVIKLAEQLQKNRKIKILDLQKNLIDDEATKALVKMIFSLKGMPALDDNRFTASAKELLKFFRNLFILRCTSESDWQSDLFITILGYAKEVTIMKDSILEKISKLQKLVLLSLEETKDEKGSQLTVYASEFFLRFVNLTTLIIRNVIIPKNSMTLLAEAFTTNLLLCLKKLTLNDCGITSEIAIILLTKLRNTVYLEELQLCNNYIDDNATEIIVTSIFCWHSLKTIKLDNNRFTLRSIKLFHFIAKHFISFSNESIDFSGESDKVNLLISLLEYAKDTSLDCVSELECLCLDCFDKEIAEKQLELTVNAATYFQQFNNLLKLNISGITVGEQASDMLAIAFGTNLMSLECLLMNGCNLTSAIVVKLVKKLHNAKNIKEIQFCNNQICDKAIETLAVASINWEALEIFKLDKNEFMFEYVIFSLLLALIGKESQFFASFEGDRYTHCRDFYIMKTMLALFDYASNHTGKNVSHFTNSVSKITNLSFYYNSTNSSKPYNAELELTVGAAAFFTNLTNMTKLDLSGVIINEEVTNTLCKSIDFSKLESVRMNNCKLTSKCVIKFLHMLKYTNIQVFQISNNFIDDDATKALMVAILHWNSLRDITLEYNAFSLKFRNIFQFIMKFLESSKNVLTFTGNLDDVSSFITLLEYIKDVPSKHSAFIKNLLEVRQFYLHYSDKLYFGTYQQNIQEKPVYRSNELLATDTQLELSSDASNFFQRFVNLTKMSMNGIKMNEIIVDNLVIAFGNNIQTLHSIVFNHCSINSNVAIKFVSKLQKAKNITELQLCNNHINDEATTAIVIAMLHWNALDIMELDNNDFSYESMDLFRFICRNYYMLHQDSSYRNRFYTIECNHGLEISMLSLLDIMKNVSNEKSKLVQSFTCVNQLSLNCSSDQQMTIYASLFFNRFINLNKLDLIGIRINVNAMSHIANAFASNLHFTLQFLTVSNCHLDSLLAAKLLSSVNKNYIRTLCLSNNEINNEVTEALNQFFNGNKALESIDLSNNCLTTETIFSIKESIATHLRKFARF